MNVRYKLVDDCYIDTQFEYPKQGFKMIALNKFCTSLKCTTVEYVTGGKHKYTAKFNLASRFEDWNKQERFEKLCFHPKVTPPRTFNTFTPFDAAQMEPLRKEQRNAIAHLNAHLNVRTSMCAPQRNAIAHLNVRTSTQRDRAHDGAPLPTH